MLSHFSHKTKVIMYVVILVVPSAFGVTYCAIKYPEVFREYFVPHVFLFVVIQLVAVSLWPLGEEAKKHVFDFTGYVYYFLIGIVLFLSSQHIDADLLEYKEREIQYKDMENEKAYNEQRLTELKQAKTVAEDSLPLLRIAFARAQKNDTETKDEIIKCAEEMLQVEIQQKIKGGVAKGPSSFAQMPTCLMLRGRRDAVTRAREHVFSREQQIKNMAGEIEERDKRQKIFEEKTKDGFQEPLPVPQPPEVMWIATIFFYGLILQLGKISCAIFPRSLWKNQS